MDKIDYINNFEFFKMANELATELYPSEYEEKAEREMLIDYKAVIRRVLKSKSKIIAHDKADTLLKFLNPKRKWPWDESQTLAMTYQIEPSFEVFFELLQACNFKMENTNDQLIYKFLILNEIYDLDILNYLFAVYGLEAPVLEEPFADEKGAAPSEEEIKKGKAHIKKGKFKPDSCFALMKFSMEDDFDLTEGEDDEEEISKLMKMSGIEELDDFDDIDDIDIEDIDIEIDDVEVEDIELDMDLDDEDFDDEDEYEEMKKPSKTALKTKPVIQKTPGKTSKNAKSNKKKK